MLDAPRGNDGDDSQPPSLPPSLGLSYRTPRTPSLRHRSVTPPGIVTQGQLKIIPLWEVLIQGHRC